MTIRMTILALLALFCFAAVFPSFADTELRPAGNPVSPSDQKRNPSLGERLRNHNQQVRDQGMKEKREALREKLMQLPPEQRKAKIQELKQTMAQQRELKLNQKKQEFQSHWDNATPEQRAKFCSNVQQKCSAGESDGKFACTVAQNKCAGK